MSFQFSIIERGTTASLIDDLMPVCYREDLQYDQGHIHREKNKCTLSSS